MRRCVPLKLLNTELWVDERVNKPFLVRKKSAEDEEGLC